MLKLSGERLFIIPCSIHIAKAMTYNHAYLPTFLRVTVPADWPSDDVKAILPFYIEELEKDPTLLGWGPWILIDPELKSVIGDAGFKGKPDASGAVELGYGIHPNYRNLGYASEAARALTEWALGDQKRVRAIRAECDETNTPSIRVLQKTGMTCVEKEASILKWERTRA
ncbi:MAG TPA: GNAT family N-acetyltransferase [Bacillales bacterium]|nr:GNAT family N-acetyltransferase [Bacillales bacterium]